MLSNHVVLTAVVEYELPGTGVKIRGNVGDVVPFDFNEGVALIDGFHIELEAAEYDMIGKIIS
jgi:hypothetical protein